MIGHVLAFFFKDLKIIGSVFCLVAVFTVNNFIDQPTAPDCLVEANPSQCTAVSNDVSVSGFDAISISPVFTAETFEHPFHSHSLLTMLERDKTRLADVDLRKKLQKKDRDRHVVCSHHVRSSRIRVLVTGYCGCSICCGRHADGKTATGRNANLPGVAVDPDVFPLGSRLDIPIYGQRRGWWIKADDTGRKIKGYHIDVRFKTHAEAVKWGRKYLTVRVWEKR